MQLFSLALLSTGSLLLSQFVSAEHLHSEDIPSVVSAEIRHTFQPGRLRKRDTSSIYGSYTIVFGVGTPSQTQTAILDTGSSDLWVNGPWTGQSPNYNPFSSSTWKYNNSDFYIAYGSGDATGYWLRDTVTIAGQQVKNQSFGLVYGNGAGDPVFGVGFMANEASEEPYSNVPQSLYEQGLIKTPSFSVYLDNLEKGSGRILFGGVDSQKYTGQLYALPIADSTSFFLDLDQLAVGGTPFFAGNNPLEVLIDSGTTFCYFPPNLTEQIAAKFGATYDEKTELYFLDSNQFSNSDFEFNFSGVKITVPIKEMIVESSLVIQGNPPAKYVLGMMATQEQPYILGDTFLRSSYAVFDLHNKVIAMGQAKYTTNANISVITREGIPGIVSPPGYNPSDYQGGYKTYLTIGTSAQTTDTSKDVATSKQSTKSSMPWWWPFGTGR